MSDVAEQARIKVQEAVRAAVRELPAFLGGRSLEGVRVEEVFPPRSDNFWRITLSHLEPGSPRPRPSPLLANLDETFGPGPAMERVFHVLEVNGTTGEVVSMRLREQP